MPIYTPTSPSSGESRDMRLIYFSNQLPHDDLPDVLRHLLNHSKAARHPVLARFIYLATLAVRDEIVSLPAALKALVPPFETILELADEPGLRKGPLSEAIDGVLLCVFELATLIGYYECYPDEYNFDSVNTCLTGLGTGLLAAAALSLSHAAADMPIAGAEAVRVAFRMGIVVDAVSQNLEPRDSINEPATWAYVLPNATPEDVQDELDAVQPSGTVPEASKIFISGNSPNTVAISGPPSRLKTLLRSSKYFRNCSSIALPVYGGLQHASHVYTEQHVRGIVRTRSMETLTSTLAPHMSVLSTGSGMAYTAQNAGDLFEQLVSELLTQHVSWDVLIQAVVQRAEIAAVAQCQVLVFRISPPSHQLVAALRSYKKPVETSVEDIVSWISEDSADERVPGETLHSKIAIVGMSCRLPGGANDTEKFWELLTDGRDVHTKIPPSRFDVETHCDLTGKKLNASHTPYGCFVDEPGLFDAPFFNMSPREAQQTCAMQRLALVTAYEALERAGCILNRTPSTNAHRIGVMFGGASDDYREANAGQEISTYHIPGGIRAFGPGRVQYFFKTACTSLQCGEVDTVVAGGLNIMTSSDLYAGLSHGHFLTKTPNACKTWDIDADGYCRGEGIATIVLKRLEDAKADNDNILGVILAAATNHSAEAISITYPHAGAQSYLCRKILRHAGVSPLDISFLEMHGTGTQAGDTEEIKSVTEVFAPLTKGRNAQQPLFIGAVKSNVGHGEAASGATALIKLLLMFQNEVIPQHIGIKTALNPAFPDLAKHNVRIPYKQHLWPRGDKKRIAVVNNFSAAGGNTSIVVEEAPLREITKGDPRSSHLITVSAKSKASFKGNLERLLAYLEANPAVSLSDVSYTTTARRHHYSYRLGLLSNDCTQLKKQLGSSLRNADTHKPIPNKTPSVAFAFTGQGSSYKSMNLELYHDCAFFRAELLNLDALTQGQNFPSIIPAIDGSFPQDYAHSAVVTQLALVCTEIALAKYWGSLGIKPDVVVGHSLGEYAALHVAGVLSANDAIFIVGRRAQMLEQKCQIGSHKMMAVRASLAQIEQSVKNKSYEVACINGPTETVLSGTLKQLQAMSDILQKEGYKCFVLDVAFAFHSEQTDPVLDEIEAIADAGVIFHPPKLPVISPLLGKVISDSISFDANYIRRATREPVNFLAALHVAKEASTVNESTVWLEIGPHPVCMGFVKSTFSVVNVAVPSMRRGEDNWKTMAQSLGTLYSAGLAIDWNEFHRPFESGLRLLDLPTYSWNEKNHWLQYKGDWQLSKGNTFYDTEKDVKSTSAAVPKRIISDLSTSSVQRVIEESFQGTSGSVVVQSDLMQSDFYAAAHGHRMNGCGVATISIHADIALTLGAYFHRKIRKTSKNPGMNVANFEVFEGLMAQNDPSTPQLIQVTANGDISSGVLKINFYFVHSDGTLGELFCTTDICYGDNADWLASWVPVTHLVQGRIEALERLANEGVANRFSHSMGYLLFGNNLVDYPNPRFRGTQSVVINGFEAFADVIMSPEQSGTWTITPYHIDNAWQIAGFTMNVSDHMDTKKNFCFTQGWKSMRFAKPLIAGGKYRSYVKMIPTVEDAAIFVGDVYIFHDNVIVAMVGGVAFRRCPRVLLNRFFTAPDGKAPKHTAVPSTKHIAAPVQPKVPATSKINGEILVQASTTPTPAAPVAPAPIMVNGHSNIEDPLAVNGDTDGAGADNIATKAIGLIAREAGLDLADLEDEASFANMGIDSLMSLVLVEKFTEELGVTVHGSLFLEHPTVSDLRSYLLKNHS